ncbi:MAG: putative phosphatase [Phycisphaerales bacterium]|nr:putative phosphatase [Phycisphaerales bacterium]
MAESDHLACLEVRGGNVPADVELAAPGLSIHVLSRPYEDAAGGGDVHYVSSCGSGSITRLIVADVAGHGADVDAVAGVLQNLMRRYVNRIDAREFVMQMNDEFVELTEAGCFATAVVATYYAPDRQLSIINAGHPRPLLYRAASQQWTYLDDNADDGNQIGNLPLGILDRTDYASVNVELFPGDAVVCYTDSLPESRDADGELLGYDRLLSLARELSRGQTLSEWVRQWLDAIDSISPGNLHGDDLTVLLLRPDGTVSRGTLPARIGGLCKILATPFRPGHPIPWPEKSLKHLGEILLPWRGRPH